MGSPMAYSEQIIQMNIFIRQEGYGDLFVDPRDPFGFLLWGERVRPKVRLRFRFAQDDVRFYVCVGCPCFLGTSSTSRYKYKKKSVGTQQGPTDFYLREKRIAHILHKDEERVVR